MIATVLQAVGRRFAELVNAKLLPLPFPAPTYELYCTGIRAFITSRPTAGSATR